MLLIPGTESLECAVQIIELLPYFHTIDEPSLADVGKHFL